MLIRTAPAIQPGHRYDGPEPPAPRQQVPYRCQRGHGFEVTFAAGIEPPWTWDCRCGVPASSAADCASAAGLSDAEAEHERHRRLVCERRAPAELEQILADRLAELAALREAGQP